jgi:hypothetical protein
MIEVEVKVIGMFGAQFVTVAKKLQLKDGARPKEALEELHKSGAIDAAVFNQIKSLKPPFLLVLNDQACETKPQATKLQDRDSMSVIQLMAGG